MKSKSKYILEFCFDICYNIIEYLYASNFLKEKKQMDIKYYAAVDIGGSSGRLILAHTENGKIICEEIHRFVHPLEKNTEGTLVWDTALLFENIVEGLSLCKKAGKIPVSVAVDMWGVDYVLLDGNGDIVGDAVSNRDGRTEGMDILLEKEMSFDELYSVTGIQKMQLNTVYQMKAVLEKHPEQLSRAKHFLMLPDYMTYLLSGNIAAEYTNASTTAMLDARTRKWSDKILDLLKVDKNIMPEIVYPCTSAGRLLPEIAEKVGFDCEVVYPATHDTGSAVMSVTHPDCIYISSGTWSLVGVEIDEPNTSEQSRKLNFTNEGGFGGKIRYLKNIIGLWFIQCIRRELGGNISYPELAKMAESFGKTDKTIDVFHPRFLAPDSMIKEVRAACDSPDMSVDEVLLVVYKSLALAYSKVFLMLDEVAGKRYDTVCIIGGGSRDSFLSGLTAEYSGRKVIKGATEATAMGNIAAQLIASGEIDSLAQAREYIANSVE